MSIAVLIALGNGIGSTKKQGSAKLKVRSSRLKGEREKARRLGSKEARKREEAESQTEENDNHEKAKVRKREKQLSHAETAGKAEGDVFFVGNQIRGPRFHEVEKKAFMGEIAKPVTLIAGGALRRTLTAMVLFFLWHGSTYAMDVTIAWDANTEAELAGYLVYYGTDSGAPYSPDQSDYAAGYSVDEGHTWTDVTGAPPINVGPSVTTISLRGLKDSKDYFFAVRAFDSDAVESAYSREVSVIAPSKITPPHNRGWGITSGELKGFKVFYNNSADKGLTPTLGPSEIIPSFDLPNLTSLGSPLNLQPSGFVFNQPIWVELPCPGHLSMNDLSLGLHDGKSWVLVWDGKNGKLTATGEEWLDGEPEYNTDEEPFTVTIVVRHFSGVQAAVSSSQGATGSGSGGGGGCFIGTMSDCRSSCRSRARFSPQTKR